MNKDSAIEHFEGGESGRQPGLRLQIRPDLGLSALVEHSLDSVSNQEVITGTSIIFYNPLAEVDSQTMPDTQMYIASPRLGEDYLEPLIHSIATLVDTTGINPVELAALINKAQSEKELVELRAALPEAK